MILVRNQLCVVGFFVTFVLFGNGFSKQTVCRCVLVMCFANVGNVVRFAVALCVEICSTNVCCCALSSTFCHHVVGNLLLGFRANAVHNLESFAFRCKFVGKWRCRCQQNLQVAVEVEQSFLSVQV